MIIRSIGAFIIYMVVYTYITYYSYNVIYEINPSADYLIIAMIFMATPLYLVVLGLAALVKPYQPGLTAVLFGLPGFYCLAILKPEPLIDVLLPQQVPFQINSSLTLFALFASFLLALCARQIYWTITEGLTNFFRNKLE